MKIASQTWRENKVADRIKASYFAITIVGEEKMCSEILKINLMK